MNMLPSTATFGRFLKNRRSILSTATKISTWTPVSPMGFPSDSGYFTLRPRMRPWPSRTFGPGGKDFSARMVLSFEWGKLLLTILFNTGFDLILSPIELEHLTGIPALDLRPDVLGKFDARQHLELRHILTVLEVIGAEEEAICPAGEEGPGELEV